jgi:hypothetical protein
VASVDGYTGPGIETMLPRERQTLLNSSIAIIGPDEIRYKSKQQQK